MKKFFMMIALMAMPFAMQAQTKFHDVEANEATGAVKCIKSSMMGREQVINFTKEGKMQSEGMTDCKYDENGYLLSAKRSMMQGQSVEVKYKWENGRIASQTMNMMGNDMVIKYKYNDRVLLPLSLWTWAVRRWKPRTPTISTMQRVTGSAARVR